MKLTKLIAIERIRFFSLSDYFMAIYDIYSLRESIDILTHILPCDRIYMSIRRDIMDGMVVDILAIVILHCSDA